MTDYEINVVKAIDEELEKLDTEIDGAYAVNDDERLQILVKAYDSLTNTRAFLMNAYL